MLTNALLNKIASEKAANILLKKAAPKKDSEWCNVYQMPTENELVLSDTDTRKCAVTLKVSVKVKTDRPVIHIRKYTLTKSTGKVSWGSGITLPLQELEVFLRWGPVLADYVHTECEDLTTGFSKALLSVMSGEYLDPASLPVTE